MKVFQICVVCTLLTNVILHWGTHKVNACPGGCTCTTLQSNDGISVNGSVGEYDDVDAAAEDEIVMSQTTRGKKVNCSNNSNRFSAIDLSHAITIPLDTVHLDLSKNEITIIKTASFSGLSILQKLDLSENQISVIEPGAFNGLTALQTLNLSSNKLGSINGNIFTGLPILQKLMLSFNKLNTIPEGTFNNLLALKRLDFQSDYLRCDCHLQWITKWAKDRNVRVKSSTVCAVPRELKGKPLKKLKKKELHCEWPLELPMFEIKPGVSQIVFEGDKLPFDCRASVVDPNTSMFWLRHSVVVETNRSLGIFVHTRHSPDNTVMMHSLVLEDLKLQHSGEWLCLVSTPQGNVTKTVSIVVIDSNAPQCEKNTTKTSKGMYIWKPTFGGVIKELPCKMGEGMFVTHYCDTNGRWTNLNHTACDFTNEFIRKLQSLAMKETDSSNILKSAKILEDLLSSSPRNEDEPLSIINPDYVEYASHAIYRVSQHAALGDEIVSSVLSSVSKIMNVSRSILNEAQRQYKSLTRISKTVESIPNHIRNKPKYSMSVESINMELRLYSLKQFAGVHCSRLDLKLPLTVQRMVQSRSGFVFVCNEPVMKLEPLTSVLIPRSVLHKLGEANLTEITATTLIPTATAAATSKVTTAADTTSKTTTAADAMSKTITAADTSKTTTANATSKTTTAADTSKTTTVADATSKKNISAVTPSITTTSTANDMVHFQFIWYQNANLFPVSSSHHEDPILHGKSWRVISSVISIAFSEPVYNITEPLELMFEVSPSKNSLKAAYWSYEANNGFGDWKTDGCEIIDKNKTLVTIHCYHLTAFAVLEDHSERRVIMFQMMEIVVYLGSCVCLVCLIAVIVTYVSCFKFLNVPRKMKHSVINICISVLLLIVGFTMGIKRIDHERACQIVGILLHYLSLVVLFWFTVTASNMLKKFNKAEKLPPPPVDFPMPLPPKPIIRFYLLAWGVPTIICGITAAVSFGFYDETEYCFLEWEPGLGAFIGPVAFLMLLIVLFIVRISCIIKCSKGPLLNLEEMQELHTADIQLTSAQNGVETQSMMSDEISTKSSVISVMDFERRPVMQLCALVTCLTLYVMTWMFGAVAITRPFSISVISDHSQEILFSYFYGIFCALFGLFMLMYFCLTRKDSQLCWKRFFLCKQQMMIDTSQEIVMSAPRANGHVTTGSGTNESKLNPIDLISDTNHMNHVKISDDEMLSLVPSKPPSELPSLIDDSLNNSVNDATVASFYNPKQNGIAKKFWEKKNKHNSKLLTKEMTKSLNFNASESELSGSERHMGMSLCYSSDGNSGPAAQLKLECQIQIQKKDSGTAAAISSQSPIHHQLPPSHVSVLSNGLYQLNQMEQMTSLAGQEILSGSPNCSIVSYTSSQIVPHHMRTSSSSSLGIRNYASAFAVVLPRNNTLPRQGRPLSKSVPSSPERDVVDITSGPNSVARLGDFDGSSQVSSAYSHERVRSPQPGDQQYAQHHGDLQYISGNLSPPNGAMYKQYGLIDVRPHLGKASISSHPHRNRTNSDGNSSDNSVHFRKNNDDSFIQQVEQRIPQGRIGNHIHSKTVHNNHFSVKPAVLNHVSPITHKPPVSPVSDSDNNISRVSFPDSDGQISIKKQKYHDSDHNSEPPSQTNKIILSHDAHKHSSHRGMTKQRSLDWDKQFKDKTLPNAIPYAYVNHNYTEKVMQKLTDMALSEHISPKSKLFWVPRSSRSYNVILQREHGRLCEDCTSSSSDDDDSLHNIWIMQNEEKNRKNKKETSV